MDNLNKPETEEEGIRAEALRRLKVRQQLTAQPVQTPASSPSPNNTQPTTASTSDANPNTPQ